MTATESKKHLLKIGLEYHICSDRAYQFVLKKGSWQHKVQTQNGNSLLDQVNAKKTDCIMEFSSTSYS